MNQSNLEPDPRMKITVSDHPALTHLKRLEGEFRQLGHLSESDCEDIKTNFCGEGSQPNRVSYKWGEKDTFLKCADRILEVINGLDKAIQ